MYFLFYFFIPYLNHLVACSSPMLLFSSLLLYLLSSILFFFLYSHFQGPNYALAKRMQHWRAIVAFSKGVNVSSNIAPSTATLSVLSRKEVHSLPLLSSLPSYFPLIYVFLSSLLSTKECTSSNQWKFSMKRPLMLSWVPSLFTMWITPKVLPNYYFFILFFRFFEFNYFILFLFFPLYCFLILFIYLFIYFIFIISARSHPLSSPVQVHLQVRQPPRSLFNWGLPWR